MTDKRIIVKSDKDGKVLFGSHFHTLEDESSQVFKTDDLESFLSYLEPFQKDYTIYYSELGAKAFLNGDKTRWQDPICELKMSNTNALDLLSRRKETDLSLSELEDFLIMMKPFIDSVGLDLLSTARDFSCSTMISCTRKKERNGNFYFSVKREGNKSENENYIPPENMIFNIPIFKHLDDRIKFKFAVSFESKVYEETVSFTYKFSNLRFHDELNDARKELMKEKFKDLKVNKFWGSYNNVQHDTAWKYAKNTVNL